MFYCNSCGDDRGWPINTPGQSFGSCEICGKTGGCNDVPRLPVPPTPVDYQPPQAKPVDPAASWTLRASQLMVRITDTQRKLAQSYLELSKTQALAAEQLVAVTEAVKANATAIEEAHLHFTAAEPKETPDVPA